MPDARLQKIAEALHVQMPGCAHDGHGADCEGMATEALKALDTAQPLHMLPEIIAALEGLQQENNRRTQELLDVFDKQYKLQAAQYEKRVQALLNTFERTTDRETARLQEEIRERQISSDAQAQVIETLTGRLREIQGCAQRHLRDNEMMEPADVFRDAKFNLTAEMDSALRKARGRARRAGAAEEDHGTTVAEIGPQESAEGLPLKPTSSPDDICTCGCARKDHLGSKDPGGAQCKTCPGDDEFTWQHAFRLAVL